MTVLSTFIIDLSETKLSEPNSGWNWAIEAKMVVPVEGLTKASSLAFH